MKQSTKETVKSSLFEAFFVVLGVVLALAANEWRQILADEEEAQQVLISIVEEIKTNRVKVQESMDYHSGLMKLLYSPQDKQWSPSTKDFPRGFVSPARISKTAWNSASETGVLAKMDYNTVVELSAVYAMQERYEYQARTVGEIIYAELFRNGTQAIAENYRNLASVIGTFAYREKELTDQFDEAVKKLTE